MSRDLGLDREALERKKNNKDSQTFLHGGENVNV